MIKQILASILVVGFLVGGAILLPGKKQVNPILTSFGFYDIIPVIAYIDKQDKPFDLVISTYGGSVLNGNQIARALEKASARGALSTCIVKDYALSMGFTVLQYCDVRVLSYGAIIMQHLPHNGDGFENLKFETKESRIQYMFILILNAEDEAKRLGLTPVQFVKRYMYSKWYKHPRFMCADNIIDYYYNVKGDLLPCNRGKVAKNMDDIIKIKTEEFIALENKIAALKAKKKNKK